MARKNKNLAQVENVAPEAPATEAAPNAENAKAENATAEVKRCLTPGCGREAKSRGQCPRCAVGARKAIRDGKTSWAKLEALGLAIPPKHNVIGGKGVFAAALEKALGDKKD
jgi:hypothetical protein